MVTINKMEVIAGKDGILPIMHQHNLSVLKSTKQFTEGETLKCYVSKYANNRFAVWDAYWGHHNKYEVFSEEELHSTFNETF